MLRARCCRESEGERRALMMSQNLGRESPALECTLSDWGKRGLVISFAACLLDYCCCCCAKEKLAIMHERESLSLSLFLSL